MLGRVKKAPRLAELLSPKKPSAKRMDWREMYKAAEAWAGRTGDTMMEVPHE